jgi:hypothetical protein
VADATQRVTGRKLQIEDTHIGRAQSFEKRALATAEGDCHIEPLSMLLGGKVVYEPFDSSHVPTPEEVCYRRYLAHDGKAVTWPILEKLGALLAAKSR